MYTRVNTVTQKTSVCCMTQQRCSLCVRVCVCACFWVLEFCAYPIRLTLVPCPFRRSVSAENLHMYDGVSTFPHQQRTPSVFSEDAGTGGRHYRAAGRGYVRLGGGGLSRSSHSVHTLREYCDWASMYGRTEVVHSCDGDNDCMCVRW